MGHDDKEASGIVRVVSRQAGTVAGTSVVISKKIAGCGVKTVTSAKDLLGRPLKILTSAKGKKGTTTAKASAPKSTSKRETRRKKAAKALIQSLESDLTAARRELKKAPSSAEKTQSKLTSQLDETEAEKESLASELEQAKDKANEATAREGEMKTRVAALELDIAAAQHQLEKSCKEQQDTKPQPPSDQAEEKVEVVSTKKEVESTIKVEMLSFADVTAEDVQKAVFSNATDRIIFTKILSDLACQNAAVRMDVAKTIVNIRHPLSVRALAAHMRRESSPQVRQECINTLTKLELKEGLGAVKYALADQAAGVRLAAVWGLYRLGGAETASELVSMFSDVDEEVKRRAVTCIGWIGRKALAIKLIPLLDDSSAPVRRATVEAMGRLRSRGVVSSLIEHLDDPVESIRKAVLGALKEITGKRISGPFPRSEESLQHLIVRWRQWWKEGGLE